MRNPKLRIVTSAVIFVLSLSIVAPALATSATPPGQLRKDLRIQIASRAAKIKELVSDLRKRAAIGRGTLAAKSGDTLPATLTVTGKDGKNYTIKVDSKTQLRRRFWGKATLDEFQLGDTLNIIGRWADEEQTTIQAVLVRDTSIQKRHGVFVGEVKKVDSTGWMMTTIHRGDQTVTVDANTKFVNRSGKTIAQEDILVGHRVRVRGLWNRKNNTISEVTQIKDYSLPELPKNSASNASPSGSQP